MNNLNVSEFRNNLSSYVKEVVKHNSCFTIESEKGNAVILSESSYNSMIETIYLISQKGLVDKIKEGEKEDISLMNSYIPDRK